MGNFLSISTLSLKFKGLRAGGTERQEFMPDARAVASGVLGSEHCLGPFPGRLQGQAAICVVSFKRNLFEV